MFQHTFATEVLTTEVAQRQQQVARGVSAGRLRRRLADRLRDGEVRPARRTAARLVPAGPAAAAARPGPGAPAGRPRAV
jgi:hypothetical protein